MAEIAPCFCTIISRCASGIFPLRRGPHRAWDEAGNRLTGIKQIPETFRTKERPSNLRMVERAIGVPLKIGS
jgi:hypothetical protein